MMLFVVCFGGLAPMAAKGYVSLSSNELQRHPPVLSVSKKLVIQSNNGAHRSVFKSFWTTEEHCG